MGNFVSLSLRGLESPNEGGGEAPVADGGSWISKAFKKINPLWGGEEIGNVSREAFPVMGAWRC